MCPALGIPGRCFLCLIGAAILVACTGSRLAPVLEGDRVGRVHVPSVRPLDRIPPYHVVVPGDTLYAIAWRYGQDYRDVARGNRLEYPYRIHPGQRIRLPPRPQARISQVVTPPRAAPADHAKSGTPGGKPPVVGLGEGRARDSSKGRPPASESKPKADLASQGANTYAVVQWQWPADGKLLASDTAVWRQGLEIAGHAGQAVKAAAPGEVVYVGDGLIGYGKLIIIKHDDVYLSAYAHNRTLLVTEGLKVLAGQQIAEMGSTGTNQVKLYFEIRRNGKPVPPLEYLPQHRI